MRNQVTAEFLRLFSRRLTIVVVVLTIAAASLQSLFLIPRIMPLTAEDHRQAQALADENRVWHEDFLEQCEQDPDCDPAENPAPTAQDFLRWVVDFDDYLQMQFDVAGVLLVFALAVWVAVMVGADFRTGSLATQLTFTPRRLQVMSAKIITSVVVSLALVVLATVVALAVSVVSFILVRSASGLFLPAALPATVGRLVVTSLVVVLFVALVTILTGSTVAAIVVTGGIYVVGIMIQSSIIGYSALLRVIPTTYLEALFTGSFAPYSYYTSEGILATISFGDALVYFAVILAVVGLAAAVRFRRRDLMI